MEARERYCHCESGGLMGSKVTAGRAKGADNAVAALELRSRRLTYRQIGERLGITEDGARKAVMRRMRELDALGAEKAEEVRRQEAIALDEAERKLRDLMECADDAETYAKLVDRMVRIQDRRARLLGLDAPKAVDVTSGGETVGVTLYIPEDGSGD